MVGISNLDYFSVCTVSSHTGHPLFVVHRVSSIIGIYQASVWQIILAKQTQFCNQMFRNEENDEEYVAESYNFDEEETVLVSTHDF